MSFFTNNQKDRIRDMHIGAGALIYHSADGEVTETLFFIHRKTGKLLYTNGQEIEFKTSEKVTA